MALTRLGDRTNSPELGRRLGLYALLSLTSIAVAFPLLIALSYSFMVERDITSFPPPILPANATLANYREVFDRALRPGSPLPIFHYLLNSFVVSTAVVIGQLVTASLAAYAFAFLPFPGKSVLFLTFLATLMVPWEATIIPNYLTIRDLQWVDTYQGLAVPFMATGFGTFLLRQSFLQLPRDLYDAAVVDGASRFRFLWQIVLPLSRPALGTLAVYSFLATWNQYFWPLLVTNQPIMRTVQVGIVQLRFEESLRWGLVMAGVVIVVIPTILLLVLGQRQLVRGLTAGAIKG
ncbi:MAG TPA: carbohydrate ABC transporter permease [Chloroflexota bacterium]|nr:carbohydrate ABC transporter permease [Chloroflexota bacterium]